MTSQMSGIVKAQVGELRAILTYELKGTSGYSAQDVLVGQSMGNLDRWFV
jgi:hypothetical protein